MHRSKLETYEAILEALAKEPLTIDSIAYKTNVDCPSLRRYVDFLLKNCLVEERFSDKKTMYALTERGNAVFKALNLQKYLNRISKSIRAIDDALQVLPIISKDSDEQEREG